MDTKTIFSSKTIWVNTIVTILAVIQLVLKNVFGIDVFIGTIDSPETLIIAIFAVVNAVLRLSTSKEISIFGNKTSSTPK